MEKQKLMHKNDMDRGLGGFDTTTLPYVLQWENNPLLMPIVGPYGQQSCLQIRMWKRRNQWGKMFV